MQKGRWREMKDLLVLVIVMEHRVAMVTIQQTPAINSTRFILVTSGDNNLSIINDGTRYSPQ